MMEHEGKFCRIGSKLRFCHAAVLRQQAATKENGEGIMNIGYLESIFSFLGGLGMFLYGMSIMGDGMQKSAGSKLNKFLRMVTDNRLLAVGLGALITAILHSSGATTVMVVGFVNAGILNLTQAGRGHHGCKHRYNDHRMDGFLKLAGGCDEDPAAVVFRTARSCHRCSFFDVFQEEKGESGR